MSNVGMPIKTTREGNKITKICVEDVEKMLNKIRLALNKSYSDISTIIRSTQKDYCGVNGKFIIGTGISQPCLTDAFDEEIGNNIAFMKAKLNANLKKERILNRILKECFKVEDVIYSELDRIGTYIDLDVEGVRKHNPEYLKDLYQ